MASKNKPKKKDKVTKPTKKVSKKEPKVLQTNNLVTTKLKLNRESDKAIEALKKQNALLRQQNERANQQLFSQNSSGVTESFSNGHIPNTFHHADLDETDFIDEGETPFALDSNETDPNLDTRTVFKADTDIFDYAIKTLEAIGDYPVFVITRNGDQYPAKYGRYSWDQLQKDLGGGHYTILAKSKATGRIVKKESRSLAGPEINPFKRDDEQTQAPQQQTQVRDDLSLDKILTVVQLLQSNNKPDNTAALIAKSANDSNTTVLTTVMQSIQQQSQQFQNLMLEMQKSTSEMFRKITEDSQRRDEKAQERFERTIEKLTDKKDSLSTKDLFEMLEKANSKGYTAYKEQLEMAKELAEEMAGDSEGSESGLTGIIKTALPAIVQSVQSQNAIKQKEQEEHMRRLAASSGAPRTFIENPKRDPTPQEIAQMRENHRRAQAQRVNQVPPNAKPTKEPPQYPGVPKVQTVQPKTEQELKTSVGGVDSQGNPQAMSAEKNRLFELAMPDLATELSQSPLLGQRAGQNVLKTFNKQTPKITSQDFLEYWTLEDILKTSDNMGITALADQQGRKAELEKFWSDFYAYFRSKGSKATKTNNPPAQEIQPS